MIVLDASIVLELLLRGPDAKQIEELVFNGPPLHAPHLLDVECAQVLRRYAAQGQLSEHRGERLLELLDGFPITRHSHQPLLPRIWSLRANLTAYDAAYVALAEALDATLLTRDERLAAAPNHSARITLA